MFNKNLLKGKTISYRKFNYATFASGLNTDVDELILPINRSVNTYNFNFSNGALATGLGIENLKLKKNKLLNATREIILPEGVQPKAAWVFRYIDPVTHSRGDMIVFMTTENKFLWTPFYNTEVPFYEITGLTFTNIPKVINYNISGYDSLIFSSPTEGMYVWCPNSQIYPTVSQVSSAPKVESMTVHYERIFATINNTKDQIWFSKELDPLNWNVGLNDGGFIMLKDERGGSNKVISFNDYVYVFRDYGINRITAYANQTEFNVSQLYVSSGQIYAQTVCSCGDRIIMLTENGLYAFDGTNTVKLNIYINKLLETSYNVNAQAVYFNGKYYLACRLDFFDGKKIGSENVNINANNVLIELDIKTNSVNILRGVDIRCLCAITDDLTSKLSACVHYNGSYRFGEIKNCGTIFGESIEKCWESPMSDFGYPEKYKIVKDIYIKSKDEIKVKVKTEKDEKTFVKKPVNGLVHISTCMKGKLVAIDFCSDISEVYISSPTIVVGLI